GVLHRKACDAAVGLAGFLGRAVDEVVVVLVGLGAPGIALLVDNMAAGAIAHRRDFGIVEPPDSMVFPVPDPAGLVVNRDPEMSADRIVAARRDHGGAWHDPLRDAPIIFAGFGVASRPDQQAAWALDHFEVRTHVAEGVFIALGALVERIG